jgi:hypothetical protein
VKRYLRRTHATRLRIVVLDQREDVRAGGDVREVVGSAWDGRKVIFRSGSPLRPDRLALLNAHEAGAVIIPSSDFRRSSVGIADAVTIKALLSLQRAGHSSGRGPCVVAEIREERNALVARASFQGDLELVASDQVVGRLLALAIRQPGMSHIYAELLNHEIGNEIYIREYDGPATTFGESAAHARQAVCIGVLEAAERGSRLHLNPNSEREVLPGDRLILVSSSFGETAIASRPQRRRLQRAAAAPAPLATVSATRVLILGWNSRVPGLISELTKYTDAAYEIVVISLVPREQRTRVASARTAGQTRSPGAKVDHLEGDYADAGELGAVEPATFDVILIVASESVETPEYADARTIAATLLVQHLCESRMPRIVVELSREESMELLPESIDDAIVSSQIVSYMLTQVALRPDLNRVYTELFMPGGSEIAAIPLSHYLPDNDGSFLNFSDIAVAVASAGHTAIGYRVARGAARLNPPDDEMVATYPATEIVVVAAGAAGGTAGTND